MPSKKKSGGAAKEKVASGRKQAPITFQQTNPYYGFS